MRSMKVLVRALTEAKVGKAPRIRASAAAGKGDYFGHGAPPVLALLAEFETAL